MRALLAALLLVASAAVAAAPSASASPGLRACVLNTPTPAACVYSRGPDCVLIVLSPPGPFWCTTDQAPDVIVCQSYDCTSIHDLTDGVVACVPPGALNGACAGHTDDGYCAWYWLGANFSIVCAGISPIGVEACSDHLWDDDPAAWIECKGFP